MSFVPKAPRLDRVMTRDNDYQDALNYLYSRLDYERLGMPRNSTELQLGRMRRLMRVLGDPHLGLEVIHVAGTKGKGSTSAMIAAALSASGRRTALFCSPHLHRLEERYRIDGGDATPEELTDLVDEFRPIVARLDASNPAFQERGVTFFELTTAMGFAHFARRNAECVVLEVGLGGRLDSTNVVRPRVSVITTISYDHMRLLGSTLSAIAGEKAGIIKRDTPTISGVRGEEARSVIERVAARRRSRVYAADRDFQFAFEPPAQPLEQPSAGRVSVRTWRTDWGSFELPLYGPHQALNASVALASLDLLAESGIEVSRGAVERGFKALRWPARTEILGRSPWFVVDGAHNAASAEALAETLNACFPRVPRTLIFGTTREKDLLGQLRALLPGTDRFIAVKYVENPRAVEPLEIAEAVESLGGRVDRIASHPAEAIEVAGELTPRDGLICVTGSLFLAAEVRAIVLDRHASRASTFSST